MAWSVPKTYGECRLIPMTDKGERGLTCQIDIKEDSIPEGLTVFSFPEKHRLRLRTINGLERLNREIRRCTRVVVLFSNTAFCLRLVTAIIMEISDEWLTGRIYIRLDDDV